MESQCSRDNRIRYDEKIERLVKRVSSLLRNITAVYITILLFDMTLFIYFIIIIYIHKIYYYSFVLYVNMIPIGITNECMLLSFVIYNISIVIIIILLL